MARQDARPLALQGDEWNLAYEELCNIQLVAHSADADFSTTSTFSRSSVKIHRLREDDRSPQHAKLAYFFEDTFKKEWLFSQNSTGNREIDEALNKLFTFKDKLRHDYWAQAENRFFHKFCYMVLHHLTTSITLNRLEYKSLVENSPHDDIKVAYTGIGSRYTWHGSPDCSLRGTGSRQTQINILLPRTDQDDVSTDGDVTHGDAKLSMVISKKHLPQLVSMNVVSNFIAANRHPNLIPVVPSLLISPEHAVVSFYNIRNDSLLLSRNIRIATCRDDGDFELTKTGILFLWLILNHRLFFNDYDFEVDVSSGIRRALYSFHVFELFKQLDRTDNPWPEESSSGEEEGPKFLKKQRLS